MADTGAPWNLPYPLSTDLVRDGAQAIEDLAEATADGLDAAGGLVAVKHALKTDAESFTSVATGGNVAVPGLSITHEVADPANRLIITAYFGAAANTRGFGNTGIGIAEDGTLIGVGDAEGLRPRVGTGPRLVMDDSGGRIYSSQSLTFVHTPGLGAKTYTVRAINIDFQTQTVYVNRSQDDGNNAQFPRASSALVIQEVKV